jgi:4-amino-4-deoxy-L-arabinose transferase-like glycosyltransferase
MALLRWAVAGVLAAAVVIFLAVSYRMLTYPHEVVVSEGAVGLAVRSILEGTGTYDPVRWTRSPFVIVHYTPLYYWTTAAVQAAFGFGSVFLAGRLVSVVSTAVTAVLAGAIGRRLVGRAWAGWAAGALWLSFHFVTFWGTSQRVDALAILFEAAGMLAVLRARERGRPGWGGLPWFWAAWATKQVMVVGLLASAADLLARDRRAGLRYLGAGMGAIVLVFLGGVAATGGALWHATVLGTVSDRADTPWVVFTNAERFFASPWNVLLLLGAAAAAWWRRVPSLLGWYLGMGTAIAVATDANLPRFFPPMLAMAVMVPPLIASLRDDRRALAAALVALTLVGGAHTVYEMRPLVRERVLTLVPGNQRVTVFPEAVRRHSREDGLVLAQDVGMLLTAGRRVLVADPLVFSILRGNGAWEPDELVAGVRARRYDAVVLNRPIESVDEREWTTLWIAPAREALLAHYRLAETVTISQQWYFLEPTRYVYVPKEP